MKSAGHARAPTPGTSGGDGASVRAPNIVEELRFEVDFASPEQAWRLEAQLAAFARGMALEVIDEVCGQVLGDAGVLRLDTLEIDLGEVDDDNLEAQWSARLREELSRQLAELKTARAPAAHAATLAARDRPGQGSEPPATSWRSPAQAELDALLHYLQHGRLPWGQPAHTDPTDLARRCALSAGDELLRGLRALPDAAAVRARLVRQFPADWLRRLEQALLATTHAASGPSSAREAHPFQAADLASQTDWPADWAGAEARLRAAWLPRRPGPAPASTAPGNASMLRRFKALLVDDAPLLDEEDMAELLAIWPTLLRHNLPALRDHLLTWGAYARVRRRMAALWPEPLLLQLPGLWLPQAEQGALVAALQQARVAGGAAPRRPCWQRLLRTLLAGGNPVHHRAADLLAAWHGDMSTTEAHGPPGQAGPDDPAGPDFETGDARWPDSPRPSLWLQLQSLAGGPPAQGRAGLRELGSSWAGQRLLAALLTPTLLARCLRWWMPAEEAAALGALAFEPLPAVWQNPPAGGIGRSTDEAQGAERRCQWLLHHIAATDDAAVTAHAIAQTWCQAIALQHGRDADALFDDLRTMLHSTAGSSAAEVEQRRGLAWMRWLDRPASGRRGQALPHGGTAPADATARSADERAPTAANALPLTAATRRDTIERLSRALLTADWLALGPLLSRLDASETAALRGWARRASATTPFRASLAGLPLPLWPHWLGLLLPDAHAVAQAVDGLSRSDGHGLQPALQEQVLNWALAQPGAGATGAEAADPSPRPEPVRALAWQLAQPDEQARQAVRRESGTPVGQKVWASALDGPHGQRLLTLFLGADAAGKLRPVLTLLLQELGASTGASDDAAQALRRQLLQAVLWTPPPGPGLLAGHLLERAAAHLDLPPPLLVQRLLARAGGHSPPLLRAWAAQRVPVDLGRSPGRPPASALRPGDGASPRDLPAPPEGGPPRPRDGTRQNPSSVAAVSDVVTLLRGSANPDALPPAQAQRLLQLVAQGDATVRDAAARELESPLAASRVAQGLAADDLLRLLRGLRPADAPALQQLWPALQSLAPVAGPASQGWPVVARTVLRELFELDRPLHPAGLLQRTEQALSRVLSRPSPMPQASAAALAMPVARAAAALPPPARVANPADEHAAEAVEPDGPLFVDNAGLVLLAPYLPRLFGRLGLNDGQRFVDADAAGRAALVTHYLVSGETTGAEPLLMLNKLLCGLPLQAPVPRRIELAASEREAADGLLLAVIAHWKALGQTSPAGLRQTFLQREGRLDHVDEAWQLEVPPQTFDLLLDRLPWGYATLRFPWMPEVLHVQWR